MSQASAEDHTLVLQADLYNVLRDFTREHGVEVESIEYVTTEAATPENGLSEDIKAVRVTLENGKVMR